MTEPLPELLTPEEVAEHLRITLHTVYAWARTGKLPHIRIAGTVRFRRDALEALTEAQS